MKKKTPPGIRPQAKQLQSGQCVNENQNEQQPVNNKHKQKYPNLEI
jgi:hypothetical protein